MVEMVAVEDISVSEGCRRGLECKRLRRHARMKRSPSLWAEGTVPIGTMDDGAGGVLEGANCNHCRSTLWRKARRQ